MNSKQRRKVNRGARPFVLKLIHALEDGVKNARETGEKITLEDLEEIAQEMRRLFIEKDKKEGGEW